MPFDIVGSILEWVVGPVEEEIQSEKFWCAGLLFGVGLEILSYTEVTNHNAASVVSSQKKFFLIYNRLKNWIYFMQSPWPHSEEELKKK